MKRILKGVPLLTTMDLLILLLIRKLKGTILYSLELVLTQIIHKKNGVKFFLIVG